MNTIFTVEELKEQYSVLVRMLGAIQAENAHIQKALDFLERIPASTVPGDIAGQARANAAGEIVKTREQTNLKLLGIYEKMYEDLRQAVFQKPEALEEPEQQ